MTALKILVIADAHYVDKAQTCPKPDIHTRLRLEFLKIIGRRHVAREKPDVIVLAGDLVNDGLATGVVDDWNSIKTVIKAMGVPSIFIPGNRDADYKTFFSVFEDSPGPHFIREFIIYTFADKYLEDKTSTREVEEINKFNATANKYPGKKIIAFQHSPVYPPIKSDYPYNPINAGEIQDCYAKNRVILSVSGHYHKYLSLTFKDGVGYLTTPALCCEPFNYISIKIAENKIHTELLSCGPVG